MRDVVGHNSRQVARYLEWVWHLIERSTQTPETPMNRKSRGSWKPPVGENAHIIMENNRYVTPVLEPLLQNAKRSEAALCGIYFSDLLTEVAQYPAAVSRFRNNQGAVGYEGRRARAFWGMCWLYAYALKAHDGPGGPLVLRVRTDKREEAGDPNYDPPGRTRTFTKENSYRIMVEDMEAMVLAGTHSKEGAKAAKADELMCSMGRVRDAITFVNKERATVFDGEPTGAPSEAHPQERKVS